EANDLTVLDTERRGGRLRDDRDVVPANFVDRVGQLEEERVVRVPTIEELRARRERDFEVLGTECRARDGAECRERGRNLGLPRVERAERLGGGAEDALL